MNMPKPSRKVVMLGAAGVLLIVFAAIEVTFIHKSFRNLNLDTIYNKLAIEALQKKTNTPPPVYQPSPAPASQPAVSQFDAFEISQLKAAVQDQYFKNLTEMSGSIVTLKRPTDAWWRITIPKRIWDEYDYRDVRMIEFRPIISMHANVGFRSFKSIGMDFAQPKSYGFTECPTSTYSDVWLRAASAVQAEIGPGMSDLDVCKSLKKITVDLHDSGADRRDAGQVFRYEYAEKETAAYEVWFIDGTNYWPEILKIKGRKVSDLEGYEQSSEEDVKAIANSIEQGMALCLVNDYAGCY